MGMRIGSGSFDGDDDGFAPALDANGEWAEGDGDFIVFAAVDFFYIGLFPAAATNVKSTLRAQKTETIFFCAVFLFFGFCVYF